MSRLVWRHGRDVDIQNSMERKGKEVDMEEFSSREGQSVWSRSPGGVQDRTKGCGKGHHWTEGRTKGPRGRDARIGEESH